MCGSCICFAAQSDSNVMVLQRVYMDLRHACVPSFAAAQSTDVGMAQVVSCISLRQEDKASAVSPQGQPLMQLLSPAAMELAAKGPGRAAVGASGLKKGLEFIILPCRLVEVS